MTKSKIPPFNKLRVVSEVEPPKAGKLLILVILFCVSTFTFAQTIQANPDSLLFAPPVNYGAGNHPVSIFCADLDGDLDLDLATANSWDENVSILKNNGDGTFQTKVDYGAGDDPYSVFCADLDGDNDLDLAVANESSDNVSILKNNGDATFQTKVNYGAGEWPRSVFCADLDGDSDLDLAVANWGSDNVSILKNNGDGTFQTKVDYSAGRRPTSVFCADLDGDSDLDLAVANHDAHNVSILENKGDGTFQTKVDYGAGPLPFSIFGADLDGDGDLDLAVANEFGDNVSILKNNGDGTFQTKVDYDAGINPRSVFCADLDGDSDLDLAVANFGSNSVSILKNNGDGTFQGKVDYEAGVYPISVFCADLDQDSDLDLAAANRASNNVSILKNLTVREPVELWVDIVGRDRIRIGGFQTYQLSYANFGNADAYDVILLVGLQGPDGYDLEYRLTLDTLPVDSIGWSQVPDTVTLDSELVLPIWIGNISSQSWKVVELYLKISDKAGLFTPKQGSLLLARLRYQFAPQRACAEAAAELYEKALLDYGVTVHSWQEFDDLYEQKLTEYRQLNQLVSFQSILVDILLGASRQGLLSRVLDISEAILIGAEAAGHASACMLNKLRLRQLLSVTPVRAIDPNDKAMPAGYDTLSHFVALGYVLNNMIFFENVDSATTEAEDIVIVDTLDANLDWSTLQIGAMSHPLPCSATFDAVNGIITWTCDSIMLPPDTLPPNGEGWVSFSVRPWNYLTSGTQIKNRASIKFDYNPWMYAPMDSSYVINTIDAERPNSCVHSLPHTIDLASFQVCWSGVDDPLGSGIRDYTVRVSDNGEPYKIWLLNTTLTCSTYSGINGHTYSFYSIATDNVGNTQDHVDSVAVTRVTTSVEEDESESGLPGTFSLSQNYPNPFNQTTKIEFTLAHSGFVRLNIYDLLGKKVRTLVSEHLSSGYKSVLWDGKNDLGKEAASGIYFYNIKAGDFSQTKKLVLLK